MRRTSGGEPKSRGALSVSRYLTRAWPRGGPITSAGPPRRRTAPVAPQARWSSGGRGSGAVRPVPCLLHVLQPEQVAYVPNQPGERGLIAPREAETLQQLDERVAWGL